MFKKSIIGLALITCSTVSANAEQIASRNFYYETVIGENYCAAWNRSEGSSQIAYLQNNNGKIKNIIVILDKSQFPGLSDKEQITFEAYDYNMDRQMKMQGIGTKTVEVEKQTSFIISLGVADAIEFFENRTLIVSVGSSNKKLSFKGLGAVESIKHCVAMTN